MKKAVLLFFLISSSFLFCQEKIVQKRNIEANELQIVTYGLDDIVIENSEGNELEVALLDENPHTHNIFLTQEGKVLKVTFELETLPFQNKVFRKYITKRLERARAVIKVPKNKHVTIHGRAIGITSKSYHGDISIYIERGNIELNTVEGNLHVSLFQGNVFAQATSKSKLHLKTNNGTILINGEKKISPFLKEKPYASETLTINSIHANIHIQLK
ncbi:hypothetical protein P8625_09625 [Tenacibaculum tangerinum]|uniref:Adhesin domain-containing protein n=1 Tax=Tenacibaculum tangerinum TaxID=3038772 RepID=A0ABY8L155_9FLAO|nr:hypothetical protein [Tenacibaculum tangerinum]WGH74372.1 hypothetical protein P8625_09625 [Tenacibaculum tangerinum]